jgi:argininosuccinate lyase
MPQKRNPDIAELVRGKSGRVLGDLLALLVTLKALPLAYNRDLQEDKPAVFDAARTSDATLEALSKLVSSLEFDLDAIARAVDDPDLLATDAAEALVATGVPFRAAHEQVAARYAPAPASANPATPPRSIRRGVDQAMASDREAFRRRTSLGGPAPERVRGQLAEAERRLAEEALFLSELTDRVGRVARILEEEAR